MTGAVLTMTGGLHGESLSGHTTEAIEHLRQAIYGSEKHRADARTNSDFLPIRDEPSFKALIAEPAASDR